jgi:putative PIN family toxin of toxin-antitoxin system
MISASFSPGRFLEFDGVLCGKKFNYPPDVASAIVHEIELIAQILPPKRHIAIVQTDPDDNMVLERGVADSANYIVSGDVHLLDLKEFEGIRITPAEFLKALEDLHE